jgi:hypothetical protein
LTKIKDSYNIVLPVKFAGIFPERRVKTMSHMLSVATHRNGQWRRPLALAGVIVALALALVFGPSAKATPAEAAPANPAVITLYSPAPYWLSEILKRTVGKEAAKSILRDMGFDCSNLVGPVCVQEGSYDPPRYFWGATVETGGSAYYLNARERPSTSAPIVKKFTNGWKLTILCQTTGPWVNGRWGSTNIWNYVGRSSADGRPMFVSDGFVRTGSDGFVAGDCANTNMGSG